MKTKIFNKYNLIIAVVLGIFFLYNLGYAIGTTIYHLTH